MTKKHTPSMRAVGYVLLLVGIVLLIGRVCSYVLSLGDVVSPPVSTTPPSPALTSASVENGMVYFVADRGLYAMRASDGTRIWNIPFFDLIDPPIIANGMVYLTESGGIVALRGSDGRELWRYPVFDGPNSQPAQFVDGMLYVYDGQTLHVIQAATGMQAWSTGDLVSADGDSNTLTVSNGAVYYAINDGSNTPTTTVHARRASDGATLWTYTVPGQGCAINALLRKQGILFASANCSSSGAGQTLALRASDGSVQWKFNRSGQYSVTDGVVYLTSPQGSGVLASLYVLQASNGKLLWSYGAGGAGHTDTQVWTPGNGYVYVLSNGALSALASSDGAPAWHMNFHYDAASRTLEQFSNPVFAGASNNIVYIQSAVVNQQNQAAFNRLYALQANSGKQLWSFQQPQSELTWFAVTIDASTGTISIQGTDSHYLTAVYLLRTNDGKSLGGVEQTQQVNTVFVANGTIYITRINGDGDATPFIYRVEALHPDTQGGTMLWSQGT